MGDGFYDVFEMILDLSLGNTEHLGQLVRGQACADQQFDHALTGRACGSEHKDYRRQVGDGVKAESCRCEPLLKCG